MQGQLEQHYQSTAFDAFFAMRVRLRFCTPILCMQCCTALCEAVLLPHLAGRLMPNQQFLGVVLQQDDTPEADCVWAAAHSSMDVQAAAL